MRRVFVHFLFFFFPAERRMKEKVDGKRTKKKGLRSPAPVLEKRFFRIKCSERFSSLMRDCGAIPSANPTVPDLLVCAGGGGGGSRTARRENSGERLWTVVVHSPLAVRVAVIVCGRWSFAFGAEKNQIGLQRIIKRKASPSSFYYGNFLPHLLQYSKFCASGAPQ